MCSYVHGLPCRVKTGFQIWRNLQCYGASQGTLGGGGRCKWRCTFATTSHKSFAKSRRSFWFTSMHFQTSMEFLKRTIATEDTRPRERFIEFYFEFGLNCDVIKSELYLRERHLKRVLTVRENTRGKACPDLVAWVTFISNHLQCSGQLHGY